MAPLLPSPRIISLTWGRLKVEGFPPFKDAKLYPGGGGPWDWNETGTNHDPGIQPADVQDLLDRGAEVVVLSQGITGRLQVHPQTVQLLEELGIPVHVLKTEEAVQVYNRLRKTRPVGGLFHSTC